MELCVSRLQAPLDDWLLCSKLPPVTYKQHYGEPSVKEILVIFKTSPAESLSFVIHCRCKFMYRKNTIQENFKYVSLSVLLMLDKNGCYTGTYLFIIREGGV